MEASPQPSCILVPCHTGSRLDFSWGHGTELRISEISCEGGGSAAEPYLTTVAWSTPSILHRALADTSAPLRASLVASTGLAEGGTVDAPATLADYCVQIRQQLAQQCAAAQELGAEELADTLAWEGAAWGLLELLYVVLPATDGYFAEDLALWLKEFSPHFERWSASPPSPILEEQQQQQQGEGCPGLTSRLATLLDPGRSRPDLAEDYWPCMVHLVAVGRLAEAMELLVAHDAMGNQAVLLAAGQLTSQATAQQHQLLDALYLLLRQRPAYRRSFQAAADAGQGPGAARGAESKGATGREFDNMAEFLAYRATYQAHCRQLPQDLADLFTMCMTSSPATAQGVLSVLRVLSGEVEAVGGPPRHWGEAMVARLLHLQPNLQAPAHLAPLLQAALAARPAQGLMGALAELVMAVAEGPVQAVVEVLSRTALVSLWFMAHCYDLLAAAPHGGEGSLEAPLPLSGGDQAEYWRLLFAETLLGSMTPAAPVRGWPLALQYLTLCPQHGAEAAELMLQALPVALADGHPHVLHKALAAAQHLGMGPATTSMCRAAAASAWYAGRLGTAAVLAAGPGGARDTRLLAVLLQPVLGRLKERLVAGQDGEEQEDGWEVEQLLLALDAPHPALPCRPAAPPPFLTSTAPSSIPGSLASGAIKLELAGSAGGYVSLLLCLHQLLQAGQHLAYGLRGQAAPQPSSSGGTGAGWLGDGAAGEGCGEGARQTDRDSHRGAAAPGEGGALEGRGAGGVTGVQQGGQAGSPADCSAARSLRGALRRLLASDAGCCLLPASLILPLLTYLVPFLESCPPFLAQLSPADVSSLIAAMTQACAQPAIGAVLQLADAKAGVECSAHRLTQSPLSIKAIRLALARAQARVHAQQSTRLVESV
ncbi:Nup85 nucleoporin-domain-containing protein [Haematococcus lacustris]